uniref:Anoctamin n=1 Tax=Neogobius melanostomus TaxID=47308 RepID=A0A8C6TE89_9GOBI
MLRRGSELNKGDREVLLDLDHGPEAHTTDSYGSVQGGIRVHSFIILSFSDFVLVWEVRTRRKRRSKLKDSEAEASAEGNSRAELRRAQLEQWRDRFTQNLQAAGLLMEKASSEKKTVHFLKLSAPWDVLVYYAEELCQRAPLQSHLDLNTSARVLSRLYIPNILMESVPNRPLDYYTCAFRKSKLSRFLGSKDQENYFTHTQRHRMVYEILARTVYGKRKRAEVGVDRLINEGVYTAAFPMHEGPFQPPGYGVRPEELNQRQVLYHFWARWCKWYKYQPLDHIREYFGEKIALYFAWLGFYTTWLLPAAVVGTLVFVSGVMTMGSNIPAEEICNNGSNYLMCPLCNTCKAWNMSEICPMAKLGYLFDHPGTVLFSVFMSFWAVTFLEYWKRKMALWLITGTERPRPEFVAMAPMMEENPVTGVKEPYFPEKTRLSRMFTGSMVIILMVRESQQKKQSTDLFLLVSRLHFLLALRSIFYHSDFRDSLDLVIEILTAKILRSLAEQLTKWEMHRTQTQYDNAFILKVFIFQFVNFYSSPFYVAFFKGRFVGYPTNYGTLFGMRNEDCGPGGCLIELAEQLFIIMVGKQLINNVQEFVLPKVKAWQQKRTLDKVLGGKGHRELHSWEEDYQLLECEGLFEEYLEMVLQFGFITIFVAAFPLAPLFALLNNWVEIRLDAHKFVCEYRRPVAERAQNIGVWFNILEALSHLSVIANAFLIAFTSDFLPRLLYQFKYDSDLYGYVNFSLAYAPLNYTEYPQCRYKAFRDNNGCYTLFYWELLAVRLGFIIAFEHAVFFVLRAIDWIVPDIPESLELKMKRERYLAKQALAENQEALLVSGAPGRGSGTGFGGSSTGQSNTGHTVH